jgi:phosphoribosylaminoimidazole-succinocarboxamide synthase
MVVKKATPLPVECVVRGYLAGSGWKEYQSVAKHLRHRASRWLATSAQLPEPIFTPATKAASWTRLRTFRGSAASLFLARSGATRARSHAADLRRRPRVTPLSADYCRRIQSSKFGVFEDRIISSTKCSRPIPRASGPPTNTAPASARQASTNSSSAITSKRSIGTRRRPRHRSRGSRAQDEREVSRGLFKDHRKHPAH